MLCPPPALPVAMVCPSTLIAQLTVLPPRRWALRLLRRFPLLGDAFKRIWSMIILKLLVPAGLDLDSLHVA